MDATGCISRHNTLRTFGWAVSEEKAGHDGPITQSLLTLPIVVLEGSAGIDAQLRVGSVGEELTRSVGALILLNFGTRFPLCPFVGLGMAKGQASCLAYEHRREAC